MRASLICLTFCQIGSSLDGLDDLLDFVACCLVAEVEVVPRLPASVPPWGLISVVDFLVPARVASASDGPELLPAFPETVVLPLLPAVLGPEVPGALEVVPSGPMCVESKIASCVDLEVEAPVPVAPELAPASDQAAISLANLLPSCTIPGYMVSRIMHRSTADPRRDC